MDNSTGFKAAQAAYDNMSPPEDGDDQEGIDTLVEFLMTKEQEFCATTPDGIAEAMSEAEPIFWQMLSESLAHDAHSALPGQLIRNECDIYWTKLATERAIDMLKEEKETACPNCGGKGCPKCESDEE